MSLNNTLLYGDSPLACAWLASSLEKKLSKRQYLNTSITDSARAIERSSDYVTPNSKSDFANTSESASQIQFLSQTQNNNENDIKKEPEHMTLRISGQLLYGVVKIYSRKTRYLFEEVSLALIQLKSAFAITKSITIPIEQTVISSLDSITLKDTVTEANVLYDTETFNLDKVFGITVTSARNTQSWETTKEANEPDEDGFSLGDISVGRNIGHESDVTGNAIGAEISFPEFENNRVDADYEVGNESIDALARRAQPPADDLDGADEFELPLDLDFKPALEEAEAGEIAGITDFQLSAVDNMDLEFTVDDTDNHIDSNMTRREANEAELDHSHDTSGLHGFSENEENIQVGTEKRSRKYKKREHSYKITDVVRTQRKRLVVDNTYEISTDQLKKNQREYPGHLRKFQFQNPRILAVDVICDTLVEDLQPHFLNVIGSTWKSIKRRRLLSGRNSSDRNDAVESPSVSTGMNNDLDLNVEVEPIHENEYHEIPTFEDNFQNQDEVLSQAEEPSNPKVDEADIQTHHTEENLEIDIDNNVEAAVDPSDQDEDIEYSTDPKVKSKTTIEVAQELRTSFDTNNNSALLFDDIVNSCNLSKNKKSSATKAFFELLVLGSGKAIKLHQDRLFGEITVEAKEGLYENFL